MNHSLGEQGMSLGAENSEEVSKGPEVSLKARKRRALTAIASGALLLILVGMVVFFVTRKTPIEAAAETCMVSAEVADGGRTITFDNVAAAESPGPDTLIHLVCVLHEIDVPTRVVDHMDQTRALDGRQEDSWESFTAAWTYHPDDGINMTIIEE